MEALMIASTVMSVAGAMEQADAQAENARAQAAALDYQATIDRNNAKAASEAANAREEQQRRQFRSMEGQARAGIAQSGTGFEGSNADILKQNEVLGELDALTIRYEGDNKAKGLIAQSQLNTYNAGVSRMNASNYERAGMMNAGANLLSGATKYSYYKGTGKMPGLE
jgi:uncharacterized protein involved in type VI secretion and phage assembly